MSYWSHNPELLEEVTIKYLPEPWKSQIEIGDINIGDVPSDIVDRAMAQGTESYWADLVDYV